MSESLKTTNLSASLLTRIPLFSQLPFDELNLLLNALDRVRLNPGDILFKEGELAEHLYIVARGQLEINMASGTANELILNVINEGEYLGEMGIIMPGGRRTAGARARGDVLLLSMSRTQFQELLQRHPELANAMVSVLSSRLDSTNVQTFRDLTEKNRQLQTAYDELKAAQEQLIEKERLEKELQVAAEIQMSILPDVLPSPDGYDFGGRILPARQVGGDFYDVFELGNGKMGVLIGDVSDKGVPSAIFMARAHALIIAEADNSTSPGAVLRMVNEHITRLEKSTQFVTALYGVLDTLTGEFSYARAGHEPPLLIGERGDIHRLPHEPGMALGLWEDMLLDENSIRLAKGSLLVMFTDGMTDCRDPNGVPFGLERIKETMKELRSLPAQAACDRLFSTLMDYQNGAKQDDDVTLLAIHAS
ncbi:MAG TPA: SpoIIE family protein phosphatase [Anaerolineales bacterium]|nr:SpoIIE family protein phosphatase [Anaerolineales bacterium]HNQ93208.1 SpoIIE family protein phosphatase [Anaerolineales bacterium]HNS60351.1 SpoIIE family protein phosphatase [Anaerolineales bacterium]